MPDSEQGLSNQQRRARKDLLRAAARLMKEQGRKPTMEEIAETALMSRATAYRYFPNVEALLVEAPLDGASPEPETLFADDVSEDPVTRLDKADAALHDMIRANEAQLRLMLARSLERPLQSDDGAGLPARQNRRTALIEAALEPARAAFEPEALQSLQRALAFVIGTEAMVVSKDVLQLDDAEARRLRRWMIRALVAAARSA